MMYPDFQIVLNGIRNNTQTTAFKNIFLLDNQPTNFTSATIQAIEQLRQQLNRLSAHEQLVALQQLQEQFIALIHIANPNTAIHETDQASIYELCDQLVNDMASAQLPIRYIEKQHNERLQKFIKTKISFSKE
ncbi:hypothetical protein [Culicoidibacter larvae]|uniref:Uncharacterized protein n=1 Tax=Culicoidibacter larvae TaxID=2579976 RepID=A0A5R8Q860_9FIRM|nr:hypothetical protein [Culicoidibacter larvae]TLG71780.1 hypothetical protein FEZ08_10250 [Culicoidibacter larvae]